MESVLESLSTTLRGFAHSEAAANISGAAIANIDGHPVLAVVSDEGREIALVPLARDSRLEPTFVEVLSTDDQVPDELDLEGVSFLGTRLYVCGSMSLRRKKPRKPKDVANGREAVLERLSRVEPAGGKGNRHAEHVYALDLRVRGGRIETSLVDTVPLRERLLEIDLLAPFAELPSKDNGLDVEGFVARPDAHWLGLRGPVLRGWAFVVRLGADFRDPELFPLDLDGYGIRAMTVGAVDDELQLISGPTLAHDGPFTLWSWTPPTDRGLGRLRNHGVLGGSGKVEALVQWEGQTWIMRDGIVGGALESV